MTTLDIYNSTVAEDAYYGEAPSSIYDEGSNTSYPSGADDYGYGDAGYADAGYEYKKEDKEVDLWYGALSVGILTLGLILIVEEVRHRVDHAAIGKPFVLSVLDGVYRELATLGVVELAVHLIQVYGTLDKERKAVFADVHFLLFYTAIFNAFQAGILCYASNRVSSGLWVRTEELELDHYVEIREEFDRMRARLYGDQANQPSTARKVKGFGRGFQNFRLAVEEQAEGKVDCVKNFLLGALYTVIYPRQKARYNRLLVQVRFHELRVHFLESYNLPLKMKVSDYLVKSMMHVLEHFVHVSHSTWLLLTAVCNVLYFLMGMGAEVSGVAETSGYSLSIIFFAVMVGFVILSVFIYYHMESVFKKLMKMEHLWKIDGNVAQRNEELAAQQNNLFFLGDPHIILKWIKFMQFGYAVALATILVCHDDMEADDDFGVAAYIFSTFICYSVFVIVMARVLPLYCVTTSMGQLVDKERLHEVRATFCLEEAERKRHEDMSRAQHQEEYFARENNESSFSLPVRDIFYQDQSSDASSSNVPMVVPKLLDDSESSRSMNPPKDRRAMLADLAKLDTSSLRTSLRMATADDNSSRSLTSSRREGKRSLSDGVSAMRLLGASMTSLSSSSSPSEQRSDDVTLNRKVTFDDSAVAKRSDEGRRQRRDRRRTQSASAAIQAMRDFNDAGLDPIDESSDKAMPSSKSDTLADTQAKVLSPKSQPSQMKEPSPLLANVMSVVPEQSRSLSPENAVISETEKVSDYDDTSVSGLSYVVDALVRGAGHGYTAADIEMMTRISCTRGVARFFEGSTYKFITHILGTMVAFFLVGMRVEGFLKQQCIIPEDDHSWDLSLHDSFRLLIAWISAFIGTSLLNVIISPAQKQSSLFIAAAMDIVLCGICLGIMLEAENQRCCDDAFTPDESFVEDEYIGFRLLQSDGQCVDSTLECSCLDFGHRVYGGLGDIEPYVALIGLRVFRFFWAKRIVNFLNPGQHTSREHGHEHGHGHDHGDAGEKGTAVELWQSAMVRFPDLVEKHGEFSGEVLQAMLGIEVVECKPKALEADHWKPADVAAVQADTTPEMEHILLKEKKYAVLNPEVQEIIAAGRMGRPVKQCSNQKARSGADLGQGYAAAPMAPLEFEYDSKADQAEHNTIDSAVAYPNARLVRSMRRCERKLLPLLNKWTPVDVVITNHEMLYVEVHDEHTDELSDEEIKKRHAAREALIATDGGKGLRLCDVLAGRRIVGHLSFSDIKAVHVEREEPTKRNDFVPDSKKYQNEYWQAEMEGACNAELVQKRWAQVNQDRLRILTMHGTLFLRFHSDLADSELHPERILEEVGDESPLHKDIAFQWAQTIARHCGVGQLQQELPHFGHDDDDELRDYLHIVDKESKHHHHRRHSSIGNFIGGLHLPFKRHQSDESQNNTKPPGPPTAPIPPPPITSNPGFTVKTDEAGRQSIDL